MEFKAFNTQTVIVLFEIWFLALGAWDLVLGNRPTPYLSRLPS
jgi:hypothetical protein